MIKVFFLIFEPAVAWDKIAQARRSFWHVLFAHLLPMIALGCLVEGWGLANWGKWQPRFQKIKDFEITPVVNFEIIQFLLLLTMVLVSAYVLLVISQTFRTQHSSFLQSFTTMAYTFSPFFLFRLLDAGPMVSPWIPWALGMMLTIWVLYQAIPRVMMPDPTHAFGLYLSTIIVAILTSGVARALTALYLLGTVDFNHSYLLRRFGHYLGQ